MFGTGDKAGRMIPAAQPSPAARPRLAILAGIAVVAGIAWAYLIVAAARMPGATADIHAITELRPCSAIETFLMFTMWAAMMVAMMLPSAVPAIKVYDAVNRNMSPEPGQGVATAVFVAGYVTAWTAFSAGATAFQLGLERLAVLSPTMVSSSPTLGGMLLIAAGVYQWTPAKEACLRHCQAPLLFISLRWRPGPAGALGIGLAHGLYCIGCCWVLMGLLFVGGVMNLLWVAAIAVFVLVEKAAPCGRASGLFAGIILVFGGIYVLATGLTASSP